jgi:hypothetical protein
LEQIAFLSVIFKLKELKSCPMFGCIAHTLSVKTIRKEKKVHYTLGWKNYGKNTSKLQCPPIVTDVE